MSYKVSTGKPFLGGHSPTILHCAGAALTLWSVPCLSADALKHRANLPFSSSAMGFQEVKRVNPSRSQSLTIRKPGGSPLLHDDSGVLVPSCAPPPASGRDGTNVPELQGVVGTLR